MRLRLDRGTSRPSDLPSGPDHPDRPGVRRSVGVAAPQSPVIDVEAVRAALTARGVRGGDPTGRPADLGGAPAGPRRPGARGTTLLDRLTPRAVFLAFAEAALEAGRLAVERGLVARPSVGAARAEAVVAGADRRVLRARLTLAGGGLTSSCSCGAPWCAHAAALALLLTGLAGQEACEGVWDEVAAATPREAERHRRKARGRSDLFEVCRCPGERGGPGGLLGDYQVASPSSRAYAVTIRALDAPHNGCTCPDFATNLLGTCKHIEAVLHHLKRDAPRRWKKALAEGPVGSYLHLVFEPREAIGLRLRADAGPAARQVAERFFGPDGLPRGEVAEAWPALAHAAAAAEVEVPPEVARLGERAVDGARLERRRQEVEAEVRAAGGEQPGLVRRLHPYQVEGVAFLASRGRALLADEMGLGKTAQAIAAMARLARRGEVGRTLVVCPASLKHQWLRELREFTGLGPPEVAVVGGAREVRLAAYAAAPPVLITSYELARADEAALQALAPELLILDEAQRVRNWRTGTAAAVKGIPSRFAFVLTGTPLENRLDDLYSLMQVVAPRVFGPLWRFNEQFLAPDPEGRPAGYRNLDQLRARLAPHALRRRKEEVLQDLPPRLVTRWRVPMTEAQVVLHRDAEGAAAMLLAILKRRALTPLEEQRLLRAFQRMRMACDAAGLVDGQSQGAPKLDELGRVLEEVCLGEGRKVVVFSEWERMQAMAAGVCEGVGVGHVRLHGGVPAGARGRLIDRFRDDPRCQVFLATDAGGVGLNLQAASHVVNLDLPWNPAVLAQRIARVHRMGQREAVKVVLLVSGGSFEERIEGTLEGKRALFAAAVGDDQQTVKLPRATLARRIATLLSGEFAATTGREAGLPPDEVGPGSHAAASQALLALAERRHAEAAALIAAGQAGEALPLLQDAMGLARRALQGGRRRGHG